MTNIAYEQCLEEEGYALLTGLLECGWDGGSVTSAMEQIESR